MPTTPEHLLIYFIVGFVLVYLVRRFWSSVKGSGKCGGGACGCGKGGIKRNPMIEKYIRRRDRKHSSF